MRWVFAGVFLGACACGASETTPDAGKAVCRDGDESVQRHGAPCLCCHADEFGVGGSVDAFDGGVARVVVIDAKGSVADMKPNQFDNFFRHFEMTPPFSATVYAADGRALAMTAPAPSGDCNACHVAGGVTSPIHGP